MNKFTDKFGVFIAVHDSVLVPEPNESDLHNFEFVGMVNEIKEDGIITVEDQDGDFFDIEHYRLELV